MRKLITLRRRSDAASPEPTMPDDGVADSGRHDVPQPPDTDPDFATNTPARTGIRWASVVAFAVLPATALVLTAAAGYLKWRVTTVVNSQAAAVSAVQAATDSAVKMLSYRPDTVDADLQDATDRLTGSFRDSYTSPIHDVVIPGAKQDHVSAVATVPAAAAVSATPTRAVVLVFVNQTTTVGSGAPTASASTIRVTLDNIDRRWLVSQFEPI